MYKIVFIDLDGTLLNKQKEISKFDVETLQKLRTGGVKIVFASARGFYRILPYIKIVGNDGEFDYTLAFNGSVLTNNTQSMRIVDNFISKENMARIVKYLHVWKDNVYVYCDRDKYKIEDFNMNEKAYKVVLLDKEEEIVNIRNKLQKETKNYFEITSSEPTRIEFVRKE